MRPKILHAAFAIVALPVILGLAPPHAAAPAPAKKIEVGQPAPPFTLKTLDRKTVTLADLRGEVVVINLWATWCAPCRSEMPMIDAYYRANQHKGLRIFGVQTEDSVEPRRLKELSQALAYPLSFQFFGEIYRKTDGVPTTYVIDRNGIVRFAKAKVFNEQEFDALLRPLMAEPRPAGAPPAS